jgi:hypothetical protein
MQVDSKRLIALIALITVTSLLTAVITLKTCLWVCA